MFNQQNLYNKLNNSMNYYPFGMIMPGRKSPLIAGDEHRFGFNGEQKDDEIKGEGNSYDYGNRMYDPRVGRFLSQDAYASKAPDRTPYNFAGNMPIWAMDNNGDSVLFYSSSGKYLGYSNDNQRYKDQNLLVIIDDKHVKNFNYQYNRKRGAQYKKENNLSSTQVEAHVAGLEAMGKTYDVTDIKKFYNKYYDKKLADPEDPNSAEVKEPNPDFQVEWGADLESADNPIVAGKKNWVKVNSESRNCVNDKASCYPEGGNEGIVHIHTGWLGIHPPWEDKQRLKNFSESAGEQQWHPIVNGNVISFNSFKLNSEGKVTTGTMINITIDFQKFKEVKD